ncbi:MAG: trehalose-6-phosphate synthase [Gemmatimonadota bacterium]|nr:trehalose-6-phosphate synthase [Gemmatimonadota bacterium]
MSPSAFVVAANRLPVRWSEASESWESSPGGLVSALRPILEERRGTWVGWTGQPGLDLAPFDHDEIRQHPVTLDAAEIGDYYHGFCNATIWPLYHNAIRTPEYHRHWWRPYETVNRRFAAAICETMAPDGTAWVHDYHLQLVPALVRERHPASRIGFFLHIPFPPIELFGYLPWRREVLRGLIAADVLAFQTRQSVVNFTEAAVRFLNACPVEDGLDHDGRFVRLQWSPIAVDTEGIERLARSPDVAAHATSIRSRLGDRKIVLGVDRLDYTKGISNRLRAVETFFERYPDAASACAFFQIAVPTRQAVADYVEMRERVERLVGRINGRFGRPGMTPITYAYRSLPLDELVACYRAADVMTVTPFCDGMNLVAKEYVATRFDLSGVLVLSEFAGAAVELEEALLVNPCDIDWLAATLDRALRLPDEERGERMAKLRSQVAEYDVFAWSRRCLEALDAAALQSL